MDSEIRQLTREILERFNNMGPNNTRSGDISKLTRSLTTEMALLKEEIDQQNVRLRASIAILKETSRIIQIATEATESFKGKITNAESIWASYWGILKECEEAIFEMESVCSRGA